MYIDLPRIRHDMSEQLSNAALNKLANGQGNKHSAGARIKLPAFPCKSHRKRCDMTELLLKETLNIEQTKIL